MDSNSGTSGQGNRGRRSANQRFSMQQFFGNIRWFGSGQRVRRQHQRQHYEQHHLVRSPSASFPVEDEDVVSSESLVVLAECPICALPQPLSAFPRLVSSQCHHASCSECLHRYLTIEITESRTDIPCPVCAEPLHPDDVRQFLSFDPNLVSKYEEFMLRRALVVDPDVRWCPAPDCGYAVIASGCASCPKLHCERPGCEMDFCYHCKQQWHASQTCAAARAKRLSSIHSLSSVSHSLESNIGSCVASDIKSCPRCGALIVKMDDGSCNHMTCTVCAAEFCWLCMQEISDIHYLSPSGCTFWGKKQWSLKKKILLQLAMLVGGPIGISFIAIAAIPAIIIGLPVWVGRRLYRKFAQSRRYQQVLAVVGGVVSSIIVAPLLSLLSVVIGVPLLLAYVYGVVPLSLCRSVGSCGIRTSSSGVKINMTEEDDCPTPGSLTAAPFQSTSNVAAVEREASADNASLQLMRGFADSDGHIGGSGAVADHEANYNDCVGSGHRRKVVIDGIFSRLEVHAEVSFNPSGTSRRSLGEASTGIPHCGVKGRSSATVSFSDIISTSQDVDSDHVFGPRPSNTSLDSGSRSLGGCCASATAPDTGSFLPQSTVHTDSPPPLNKRSVSFVRVGSSRSDKLVSGVRQHHAPSAPWTFKRHCMSVGDSIDERVESTDAEYLSVRSLATPAVAAAAVSVPKLEPCSGGSNIVAMVAESALPPPRHIPKAGGAGTCRRCSGTMSSIDRASDCSSNLSTSSNAVFAASQNLVSKDDLRRCFSGEQIGTSDD